MNKACDFPSYYIVDKESNAQEPITKSEKEDANFMFNLMLPVPPLSAFEAKHPASCLEPWDNMELLV